MEKRERKEKRQGKKGRGILPWLICIVLLIGAVYLWFFVLKVTPLPEGIRTALYPPEDTPVPTATPEPEAEPTPEPTLYIPKPEVNIYTARLTVGEEIIQGSLRVHYINNAADTVYSVPFHLYPNTVTPGAFKVKELSLNGKRAYFTQDEDILNVPLAIELAPGEDCVIYMEFEADLYAGEYGKDGKLSYLLPAAAVYENGWLMDVLPEDVAYTAPATYSVIVEGEAHCSIPEGEAGHYYGENVQGLSVTLG